LREFASKTCKPASAIGVLFAGVGASAFGTVALELHPETSSPQTMLHTKKCFMFFVSTY
jgi:hypothetical protein